MLILIILPKPGGWRHLGICRFQLVTASSPTLFMDFSALHQHSHPIAHFACIDVEVTVFLPVQMD